MTLVRLFLCLGLVMVPSSAPAIDAARPEVKAFIDRMVTQHGFDRAELEKLFGQVKPLPSTLKAMSRTAENTLKWYEYRDRFLTEKRLSEGVDFWLQHRELLDKVSQQYGVAPEYIVAILGVETFYGRITGKDRVIDALSTLAFDYPPRSPFFSAELEEFLLLTREDSDDPLVPTGSYAGAMGPPQFMPSNVRKLGVDGDGDGKRNLWSDWEDILASIANYFKFYGWKTGEPVLAEAKVDQSRAHDLDPRELKFDETVGSLKEKGVTFDTTLPADAKAMLIAADYEDGVRFRVAFHNFGVIRRYNPPLLYDMAVNDLAVELAKRVYNTDGDAH